MRKIKKATNRETTGATERNENKAGSPCNILIKITNFSSTWMIQSSIWVMDLNFICHLGVWPKLGLASIKPSKKQKRFMKFG